MADEVHEIDAKGTLVRRPRIATPAAEEISAADNSGLSFETAKEKASSSDAGQDTSSSSPTTLPAAEPAVKDMDVYKMYLRSMGLRNAIIFLLLGGLFAVSIKFPGKPKQSFAGTSFAVLTFFRYLDPMVVK